MVTGLMRVYGSPKSWVWPYVSGGEKEEKMNKEV